MPIGYDIPWAVHACLFAYGVGLLDNALLEPLAQACVAEGRDDFMLAIAPLKVVGGTGSPANPAGGVLMAHASDGSLGRAAAQAARGSPSA